jgi:CubicO group peptidase (beta-lactamase class C family)
VTSLTVSLAVLLTFLSLPIAFAQPLPTAKPEQVGLSSERLERLKETGKPITLFDVTVAHKNDAGGHGSAGTAGDYARFLQMMLNGGQLDGARLLSRATVAYMTSDHLDTIKPAIPFSAGYGFGLGFAVRKGNGVAAAPGSAGEYNWGGAAGTAFWIDPKEEMVVVIMTQTVPGVAAQRIDRTQWRQAVYQALVD